MIDVGDTLRDYEIAARLKTGGMATLFLAKRSGAAGFSRPVAIKVVHPHLSEDQAFTRMFVDEAKLSARIVHPNVVHVEELGQHDGTYFLAMEYVHGCSLSQLMQVLGKRQRRLTTPVAVHIACKILDGLHAAHETLGDDGEILGVVHRDVSPQNILLSYSGHIKVIDFGVAKARGRLQETTSASLKGKIRYMAPEQAYGRPVDRRSDVYAVGLLLWEMLTMRNAFSKAKAELELLDRVRQPRLPKPSRFSRHVDAALDDAVMMALAPDMNARFPNAHACRMALRKACPDALSVDASEVAQLLGSMMRDTIAEQHEHLPESISRIFRQEMARSGSAEAGDAAANLTLSLTTDAAIEAPSETDEQEPIDSLSFVEISVDTPVPPMSRGRVVAVFATVAALAVVASVSFIIAGPSLAPPGAASDGVVPTAARGPAIDTLAVTVDAALEVDGGSGVDGAAPHAAPPDQDHHMRRGEASSGQTRMNGHRPVMEMTMRTMAGGYVDDFDF